MNFWRFGAVFVIFVGIFADELNIYKKDSYNLTLENDALKPQSGFYSDRFYTSGLNFSYTTREYDLSSTWMKHLTLLPSKLRFSRFEAGLHQMIHTPISRNSLDPKTDYPYSGALLFFGGITNRSSEMLENIRISLGLIGPYSLAKELSTGVHKIFRAPIFTRWDTQIKNEPILNLDYEVIRKILIFDGDFEVDYMPGVKISFGNARTHASIISRLRLGKNLGADFGIENIKNLSFGSKIYNDEFFVYAFIATSFSYIMRNIFIEGNSFLPPRPLTLSRFVYAPQLGMAIGYAGFRIYYAYTHMSREFQQQKNVHSFGSIGLNLTF